MGLLCLGMLALRYVKYGWKSFLLKEAYLQVLALNILQFGSHKLLLPVSPRYADFNAEVYF